MFSETPIGKAIASVAPSQRIAILTHHNPDPDAIAAAFGMHQLARAFGLTACDILYGGIVGRASNRAMVRELNIPLQPVNPDTLPDYDHLILVDTQPGMANNPLPDHCQPLLVLDHHPLQCSPESAVFMDHREVAGSTATIVTEALFQSGTTLSTELATALLYGIQTDTEGLARDSGPLDREMFFRLYPLADPVRLNRIQFPDLPPAYYHDIGDAVLSARVHNGVLMADLEDCFTPDMPAEMADFLLRMEGIDLVLVHGRYEETLHFSMRTSRDDIRLGLLALTMVRDIGSAGGHMRAAGGQVPYSPQSVRILLERFHHFFAVEPGQFQPLYS